MEQLEAENSSLMGAEGGARGNSALQRLDAVRYQQLVQELDASVADNRHLSQRLVQLQQQLQAAGIASAAPDAREMPSPFSGPVPGPSAASNQVSSSAATTSMLKPLPVKQHSATTSALSDVLPIRQEAPNQDSLLRPAVVAAAERTHQQVLSSRHSSENLVALASRLSGSGGDAAGASGPLPRSYRGPRKSVTRPELLVPVNSSASGAAAGSPSSSSSRFSGPFQHMRRISSSGQLGQAASKSGRGAAAGPTTSGSSTPAATPRAHQSSPLHDEDSASLPLQEGVSGGLSVRQMAARLAMEGPHPAPPCDASGPLLRRATSGKLHRLPSAPLPALVARQASVADACSSSTAGSPPSGAGQAAAAAAVVLSPAKSGVSVCSGYEEGDAAGGGPMLVLDEAWMKGDEASP